MRRNIVANYVGRAWGVVSVALFVPLYLKVLGIEGYGLVGFYSTLAAVVAFADMGLTATLNRELARLSVREDAAGEMADLVRTYESIYACIALGLSISLWFLAPFIAERWLSSGAFPPSETARVIRWMGIAIALQLPTGLYIGGLLGLQRQVLSNGLQLAWGVFRNVGAILVLWFWSPTIFAFALWQVLSNLLYYGAAHQALWTALPPRAQPARARWMLLRKTWRYAASMAGMALVSICLTQTDKLLVSTMLPIDMLGYYTIAGALASVPVMLAGPIGTAIFPRLTALAAAGDRAGLTELYHRTCELAALAVIPATLTLSLFASEFIFAWTGSATTAEQAGLVAALLLGGQLMQAIWIVPYYVSLAHGDVSLYLYVGIASLLLATPLLLILIGNWGVVGAALSWLIVNVSMLPFYVYFIHRRFLPGEASRWCLRDVGLPVLVVLPCVLIGRWLLPQTTSRLITFCEIGMVWGVALIVCAATVTPLRRSATMKIQLWYQSVYGMRA